MDNETQELPKVGDVKDVWNNNQYEPAVIVKRHSDGRELAPVLISLVGEEERTGYAIWDNDKKEVFITLGCFIGTEKEAIKSVSDKYGARSGYAMMVRAACKVAKERKVLNPKEQPND